MNDKEFAEHESPVSGVPFERDASSAERRGESPDRREFLKKAGKLGVSAGLAHFLLLGGAMGKAMAANDSCPTFVSDDDTCRPSQSDDDNCAQNPEIGDECGGSADEDQCDTPPYSAAAGDQCPEQGDVCVKAVYSPYTPEAGDECTADYDECTDPPGGPAGGDV